MAQNARLTLTQPTLSAIFFIQRYRFLTIAQIARLTGRHPVTEADQMRQFERTGLLGFFGNNRLAGNGKTPQSIFSYPQRV